MKHIVTATEDKCDKLETLTSATKKTTHHTRQLLSDLEVHLHSQKQLAAKQSVRGHLLWRIDGFAAKLKDAKENDVTLQSPIFCNRPYGYTLRVSSALYYSIYYFWIITFLVGR